MTSKKFRNIERFLFPSILQQYIYLILEVANID